LSPSFENSRDSEDEYLFVPNCRNELGSNPGSNLCIFRSEPSSTSSNRNRERPKAKKQMQDSSEALHEAG
jgi:hypothetical protein